MGGEGSDRRGRDPGEVHGLRVADHPPVHGLDELGEHPWIQRPPIAIYPIAIDVSALVSRPPGELRILSTDGGGQTFVSNPGPPRVVPGRGGPDSFAYLWI